MQLSAVRHVNKNTMYGIVCEKEAFNILKWCTEVNNINFSKEERPLCCKYLSAS